MRHEEQTSNSHGVLCRTPAPEGVLETGRPGPFKYTFAAVRTLHWFKVLLSTYCVWG